MPNTKIFFNEDEAVKFLENSTFPMIYKSSHGAGSANVGLLNNFRQGKKYVKRVFSKGMPTFFKSEIQKGYVYFQEFLEGNKGDYRVVCFSDGKLTGFFRENKPGEVFASGGGNNSMLQLDNSLLELVWDTHQRLGNQVVMSYDLLKHKGDWKLTEASVLFGNLNSPVFSETKFYERKSSFVYNITEIESNRHNYFIDLLLKSWGWND